MKIVINVTKQELKSLIHVADSTIVLMYDPEVAAVYKDDYQNAAILINKIIKAKKKLRLK